MAGQGAEGSGAHIRRSVFFGVTPQLLTAFESGLKKPAARALQPTEVKTNVNQHIHIHPALSCTPRAAPAHTDQQLLQPVVTTSSALHL
jgi:hypothetical protein